MGSESALRDAREQLYEILRRDVPFEETASDALELGMQFLDVENGHLTRIDDETDHWEAMVSTDPPDGTYPPGLELNLATTYCRRTIAADSQISLHDAPNQGWADDPAFETHGLHCYHGTTLVLDGEPYGTVCFVSEEPRDEPFSAGETMFAELIARLLERELEREQHDAQLNRQANLAIVLNRVLRHNLRNDMAVIRGYTQLMADKLEDDADGDVALRNIDDLLELSRKARELDRIVDADFDREPTDIVALLEELADRIEEAYPSATVSVEHDGGITAPVLSSFEQALEELIENAAKHGGERPTVAISAESTPNAVEIRIADDGPGLGSQEAAVLETGTETTLTHGSGLGLWLARWIVTNHDGSIDAAAAEPGTVMTVSIPRKPATDVHRRLTKLERARDQYRAAFEEATDAMVLVNDEARIVDANAEASAIYGVGHRELLGRALPEFLPDGFDFDATWCEFRNGEDGSETMVILGADGIERAVEHSVTTDVVPGQHLIICRDITDRRERERELETLKGRFEAIFNNTHTFVGLLEPDGTLLEANETALSFGDVDREEVVGKPFWETSWFSCDERTRETAREAVSKARNGDANRGEVRLQGGDGEAVIDFSIRPITDDDGEVVSLVPEGWDVTDRKATEERLREQERFVRSILQSLPDPFYAFDTDGRLIRWNEKLETVTGYSNAELQGMHVAEFLRERETEVVSANLRTILEERRSIAVESSIRTKSGDHIPYEFTAGPLEDGDGTVRGVTGIGRDVTERKERERRLEALNLTSGELMAAETRSAVAGIGVESARDILGLEAVGIHLHDEAVGGLVSASTIDEDEDGDELDDTRPTFAATGAAARRAFESGETRIVDDVRDDPDVEKPIDASDTETDVRSGLFVPLGTHGVLIAGSPDPGAFGRDDVTMGELLAAALDAAFEQVDRERQLRTREAELTRQNERLEEFAGIVSHDLRNPLAVARGRLALARGNRDDDDLEHVARAHDRMEELITDLLTLAREGSRTSDLEAVDLASIAENCWRTVVTGEATFDVEIRATIRADESRLRQLLENLMRNAIEHGGDGVRVRIGARDGGFYMEDDGPGIPEEDRDRVFETGYSTNGKGTGFGLSIVDRIADAHGWDIRVTDGIDSGARFEINGVEFVDG